MESKLLKNPLVKNWLRLKRSPNTRKDYALRLGYFLEHFEITVEELLEMSPKEARELCLIYQNEAKTKKGTPLSNNAILARQTTVASFLDYHDKPIIWKRNSKIKPRPDVTSHVFSNGDLSKMFQVGDIRDKAMLSLATSLGWGVTAFVNFKRDQLKMLLERAEETGEQFIYFRNVREKTGVSRLGVLNPLAIEWNRKWLKGSENMKKRVGRRNPNIKVSDLFDYTGKGLLSRLKLLARKAGIKTTGPVKFHNIRKWVMSGLSRSGFNEWQVKYVLGKAIPMSDGTYLQSLEQEVRERYPKAYEEYLNLETNVPRKAVTTLTGEIEHLKEENIELKQQLNGQRPEMLKLREELDELRQMLKKIVQQED